MTMPWEVSQVSVEQGLLKAILADPIRLQLLRGSGLSNDDFIAYKQALEFIDQYHAQYKAMPTDDVIRGRFTDWDPPTGEFEYWLGEMRKLAMARQAQLAIRDMLGELSDPALAIQNGIKRLSGINVMGQSNIQTTDGTIAQRLDKYLARMDFYNTNEGKGIVGLRTGFEVLNRTGLGWMPGELVGLYARPTVGKSWMLVREMVLAYMQGCRVLLISPEMPANQIALRIDTFLAYEHKIKFSHSMAYQGRPLLEPSYRALAEALKGQDRWWTISSIQDMPVSLSDIRTLTTQFQPDIIGIDGATLLRQEGRHLPEWEFVKEVMYGLKAFATYREVPIIVTHQSVNTQRGKTVSGTSGRGDDWRMPTLNDAAFGDAFVQACSTVITMCSDEHRPDLRWYSPRKVRERDLDYAVSRYGLYWDVDRGAIIDLSECGANEAAIQSRVNALGAAR